MKSCAVIIVAAGSGTRFGSPLPKQYQELGDMVVLRRTLLAFTQHPLITSVQLVINPEHKDLYESAIEGLDVLPPVPGGASRQDSVRLGLEALKDTNPDYVMIHDGARPFIDAPTITSLYEALETHHGACAARRVVDTLKREDENGFIKETVDRSTLWQAYTPQAFHYDEIFKAHQDVTGQELTDDAAVAEKAGIKVTLIQSNVENMKITTPDDLSRARKMMGQSYGDIRTGLGFDVHELVPGKIINLGGIEIKHDKTLKGHSDADVVLHALTDALYGTMAAGDIGVHFPPSDPQWKGADSTIFLRHAVEMIAKRGGMIAHTDIVIMCEEPKLTPHREKMQKRLAELMDVDLGRVSLKATTTERLGFTGRGEGIAVQAIATVRFEG